MRRGTPSAVLFGGLLYFVRITGTRRTMRQIGDQIGAPAATVSQVERGQRAVKEPKVAAWAAALEVPETALSELWLLSQGLVPVRDSKPVFYDDRPGCLGTQPLPEGLVPVLPEGPDLEPIYRLADRIVNLLRPLLTDARIDLEPEEFEPKYVLEAGEGTITPEQEDEDADAARGFVPVPLIEFRWFPTLGDRDLSKEARDFLRVPLLQKPEPIVRRRGSSLKTVELEELIRSLSGPERERVRGYIDALVDGRGNQA